MQGLGFYDPVSYFSTTIHCLSFQGLHYKQAITEDRSTSPMKNIFFITLIWDSVSRFTCFIEPIVMTCFSLYFKGVLFILFFFLFWRAFFQLIVSTIPKSYCSNRFICFWNSCLSYSSIIAILVARKICLPRDDYIKNWFLPNCFLLFPLQTWLRHRES